MEFESYSPESIAPPQSLGPRGTRSVAPAWHSVALLVLLLVFSLLSARSQHRFAAVHGRAFLYALTIGWEWLAVGYIAFGLHRRKQTLRTLMGGRWSSAKAVLKDVVLSFGFWFAAALMLAWIASAIGLGRGDVLAETRQKLGFLVPRDRLEIILFLTLSASAGVCEEIIFRGYFQRQFAAWTHSALAGAILQALLFGAGHGYEGWARMFLIAIFGAMFGALALACNSLRPGMLAHFFHDAAAGLLLRHLTS
jgi:hypothetical protein